jgi:hypothetical protein
MPPSHEKTWCPAETAVMQPWGVGTAPPLDEELLDVAPLLLEVEPLDVDPLLDVAPEELRPPSPPLLLEAPPPPSPPLLDELVVWLPPGGSIPAGPPQPRAGDRSIGTSTSHVEEVVVMVRELRRQRLPATRNAPAKRLVLLRCRRRSQRHT